MTSENNKIIGVDVDDTLLNLVGAWINAYNKVYGDNLSIQDIRSWDISNYVKCSRAALFSLLNDRLYDNIVPIYGALEGVKELRKLGRVIFVTSNFGDIGTPKFDALNRLGFAVKKHDFFEASDKSLIACNFLIDDNIMNVRTAYGKGVLFTRPWNEHVENIERVTTWEETVNYIRRNIQ